MNSATKYMIPKFLSLSHITWCDKMNEDKDFRFEQLLNRIQTLKQIKLNDKIQNIERIPCDSVNF